MNPPTMQACAVGDFLGDAYNPSCYLCREENAEAIEEYHMFLKREARDRRIGCIGMVIAATIFWAVIIALLFY